MTEISVRAYRAEDAAALRSICLRTGDSGADASGLYRFDSLLGDIYAVPYAVRDPDLTFVLDRAGTAVGYVLGTDDTTAFNEWFREVWWRDVAEQYRDVAAEDRDAPVIRSAAQIGAAVSPYAEPMPAHLHIDLLPEVQGGGWGRTLIGAFEEALRERGVAGVHVIASAENVAAHAFYDRLGFQRLASEPGTAAFGRMLG